MRLALNLHVGRYPGRFLRQNIGRGAPDRMVLKASWVLTWKKSPPRGAPGGNVRGPAVGRPLVGRRASPGAATDLDHPT